MIGIDASGAILALGEGGHRHRRDPRGDRRSASRRRRATPTAPLHGADLRLLVRRVPRRRRPGARRGRRLEAGHEGPPDGDRRHVRGGRARRLHAEADAGRRARRGRGRLRDREHQEGRRTSQIGDTVTDDAAPGAEPLPGFKEVKPMVFAGLFPIDADEYEELRDALEKLRLNDSSFTYEPETSAALGFGFRCGFLGPAAHGDRPGAARARVRPRPDHDRADGALPRAQDRRRGAGGRQRRRSCRTRARSRTIEEPIITATILTGDEYVGGDPEARARTSAASRRASTTSRTDARADHLRPAARRDRARLLRQAEVGLARLRLARLRAHRLPGPPTGQARHPGQRRAGRRAVADRPPRHGLRRAARRWSRSCAS